MLRAHVRAGLSSQLVGASGGVVEVVGGGGGFVSVGALQVGGAGAALYWRFCRLLLAVERVGAVRAERRTRRKSGDTKKKKRKKNNKKISTNTKNDYSGTNCYSLSKRSDSK